MHRHAGVAAVAVGDLAATGANQSRGEAAPIKKDQHLPALMNGFSNCRNDRGAQPVAGLMFCKVHQPQQRRHRVARARR